MDLHKLEYMIAIAKYGSITKASEALHISQPTLSAYLSGTERSLNVSLFTRVNKSLKITPEGEKYVAACREILEIRDRLMLDLNHDGEHEVRIGMMLGDIRMFNKVLIKFFSVHPDIKLLPEAKISSEIYRDLLEGRLDLGFVTSYSGNAEEIFPGVEKEIMGTLHECLYIARSHPALQGLDPEKKYLEMSDLRRFDGFPICLPSHRLLRDYIVENVIKPNGLRTGAYIERDTSEFIIADMYAEKAYTIMPTSLMPEDFLEFRLPVDCETLRLFIYPKNTVLSPPKRLLARLLKKELGSVPYYRYLT